MADREAKDRNTVLTIMYGALPCYAYFDAWDIQNAKREDRVEWWRDLLNHADKTVRRTAEANTRRIRQDQVR